jgi:hypothetical protein
MIFIFKLVDPLVAAYLHISGKACGLRWGLGRGTGRCGDFAKTAAIWGRAKVLGTLQVRVVSMLQASWTARTAELQASDLLEAEGMVRIAQRLLQVTLLL